MLEDFLLNIDQYIRFIRVRRTRPYVTFHLHIGCEIFYLIEGDVEYFVDQKAVQSKGTDLKRNKADGGICHVRL